MTTNISYYKGQSITDKLRSHNSTDFSVCILIFILCLESAGIGHLRHYSQFESFHYRHQLTHYIFLCITISQK